MKIAVDFDDTFTADPYIWKDVIRLLKEAGHSVTFVTSRGSFWDNSDIETSAKELDIDVVYTYGKQKASMFDADIWIDDSPHTIPKPYVLRNILGSCRLSGELEEDDDNDE